MLVLVVLESSSVENEDDDEEEDDRDPSIGTQSIMNIFSNPIFRAYAHARLRKHHLLPGVVMYTIVVLIILIGSYIATASNVPKGEKIDVLARASLFAYHGIFALQTLLLLVLGTSRAANSAAAERGEGILQFHRMTPLSVWEILIGYLVGMSIREYLLAGIGLLGGLACVVMGGVPFSKFLLTTMILLTSTIFFHLVGILVGISRTSSSGTTVTLASMIGVVPIIAIAFPFGDYAYLTPMPYYLHAMVPQADMEELFYRFAALPVLVFNMRFTPLFFSLLIQVLFGAFVVFALGRKLREPTCSAFSKPSAVILFSTVELLLMGRLWEGISRMQAESGILGILSKLSDRTQFLTALLGVATVTSLLVALALVKSLGPSENRLRKVFIRTHKYRLKKLPYFHDDTSAMLTALVICAIFLGCYFWMLRVGTNYGADKHPLWGTVPIATGLLVLVFVAMCEWTALKFPHNSEGYIALVGVVWWLLPVGLAWLMGFGKSTTTEVLIAISPITSIYCALVPMSEELSLSPLRVVFLNMFTSAALLILFGGLLLQKRNSLRNALARQVSPASPPPTPATN